jgi:hypothetical protein
LIMNLPVGDHRKAAVDLLSALSLMMNLPDSSLRTDFRQIMSGHHRLLHKDFRCARFWQIAEL